MTSDTKQHFPFIDAAIGKWLGDFSGCVRKIDYEAALSLVHPDVVAFGTHSVAMHGRESWMNHQWKHVWPITTGFSFEIDQMTLIVSQDGTLVTVAVPWTSTGYGDDGVPFSRPGRATMTLTCQSDEWLCLHSHMSLCRGVSLPGPAAETQPS